MSAPPARFPLQRRTSDGTRYRIRPIRASDAQRERDFIQALSPRSRYQRFMHAVREPADALIATLAKVDFHRTMALVAVTGHGPSERIIATAQYAADNDTECEFAIVVADDWQCRGVGTTLAPLLFDCAARAGFRTIYGTVLVDNHRMIELARWIGLTVDPPLPGDHTVRAWRHLQPPAGKVVAAAWPPAPIGILDPVALLLLMAANATPVLVARLLGHRFAAPIHLRIFGAHKTWRGVIAGAGTCGVLGAFLPCGPWWGLSFGLLALAGDLVSSFVKRRMHLQAGREVPLLDQLPESLLPMMVLANAFGLSATSIAGTAALFTLLDLASARWRKHRA